MNSMKIFHQCGHNTKWNKDSLEIDGVGDGLIFSPSDLPKKTLENMSNELKEKSMFDPQYYLPGSDKKKFATYEFFPGTILENEYSTVDYEEIANENAEKCVAFQKKQNFANIIIPCIYKDSYTERNLEIQKELYIIPFVNAIKRLEIQKPIYLTVHLKDSFLLDENIRNDLLSFVTSFQSIDGIYLVPEHIETYKRIRNERYLLELMKFIDKLVENDLLVHLGYSDIEGFILSLAGISSISIGAYENTRFFNIDKFRTSTGERQGPNPRVFSEKLLQNVEFTYLSSLETLYSKYGELFGDNEYKIEMFKPTFEWHFTKPYIYKNYFCEYSKLLRSLPEDYEERYAYIIEKINQSMIYYREISDSKILLDEKSDGGHLPHWANAVNMFYEYKKNK